MQARDLTRLRHLHAAVQEALALIAGRTRDDLDQDRTLNLALVRLLEIIGEAARSLSPPARQAHPEIPWQRMIGMRNQLIHAYFDIDLDIVWQTAQEDLPPLLRALERLTGQEEL